MALLQALPLSRIFKGSISLALMTVFLIIVVKKVSQAGDEIKEAKECESIVCIVPLELECAKLPLYKVAV